jgi:hypothetical protein
VADSTCPTTAMSSGRTRAVKVTGAAVAGAAVLTARCSPFHA